MTLLLGIGGSVPQAAAVTASCAVSLPEGAATAQSAGTFPYSFYCTGLPADVTEVRFTVANPTAGATSYVFGAFIEDVASITSSGFGTGTSNFVGGFVHVGGLSWYEQTGDCYNGASAHGSWPYSGQQACIDTDVPTTYDASEVETSSDEGAVGLDEQVFSNGSQLSGFPTATAGLWYYTGTSATAASCDTTAGCGSVSVVTNPNDDTSALNTWFPTSTMVEGFLTWGLGFVFGTVFSIVKGLI